jgi:DNA-binding NarL/FixJ family response regulator
MIRVFLVDDHALVRSGLRAVLAAASGLEVVGEAAHGQELLDQLPTTPADVVLLDLNMPVLDGVATAARLRAEFPEVAILVLSMMAHERNVVQALEAGAHGYVLKNADTSEIVAALHAVASGRSFLATEIGLAMLHKVASTPAAPAAPARAVAEALTARELEVLRCIAEGLTNGEIADKLFTSKRTVETHRQNIIAKTQTKNTAALIKFAAQNGLLAHSPTG